MKKTIHIFVFCLIFASCNLFQTNYVIKSDAMLPTIKEGDAIKIEKKIDSLTYGDIILFEFTGSGNFAYINGPVVSRVVALPGDNIAIEKDAYSINGKKNNYQFIQKIGYNNEYEERLPNNLKIRIYSESYHVAESNINTKTIQIPKNQYYVMGDNRTNAIDSRYIGNIPKEMIIGRVLRK